MGRQVATLETISIRLEGIERENRILKKVVAVIGASLGILLTLGAAQTWTGHYVEASRFVLKDTNGRVRGQWMADADSSTLSMYDLQEKPVMEFMNAANQGAVKLTLISSKGAVSLWATRDEAGVLVKESNSYSANERVFVGLQNMPALATVRLNDTGGNLRAVFSSGPEGGGGMILDDKGAPLWGAFKRPDSK